MSNNLYDVLWVDKSASDADIKKAYRKQAMKYHPDRNAGDKTAEKKFKEVNSAYDTLGDDSKRKQYDRFGSTWWNPFGWSGGWNPFGWWWQWFWWFEDMFSWFGWWQSQSQWFNMEDLFWNSWFGWSQRKTKTKQEPVTLDFEKTYEVRIFDLILGCKIEVSWVYGQKAKLKIPANTAPWTKFRVKEFWKSEWTKKGNLIITVKAIMPKNISDVDKQMLERISENIWY